MEGNGDSDEELAWVTPGSPAWQRGLAPSPPRSPSPRRPSLDEEPALPALEPLIPGDILLQGKEFHAVMWVGGIQPVAHSVSGTHTTGVLRHSAASFATSLSSVTRVFRYHDQAVAASAAEFAISWATASPMGAEPIPVWRDGVDQKTSGTPTKRVLKTPYSFRRADATGNLTHTPPFTVESLFRVLKAIARARDGAGLSPNHGVSCDQFVTYCYQAAAIRKLIGNGALPANLADVVRRDVQVPNAFKLKTWGKREFNSSGKGDAPAGLWRDRLFIEQQKVFRKLSQEGDLIAQALAAHVATATGGLPAAMRADPKETSIKRLEHDLGSPTSDFRKIGVVRGRVANPQTGDDFGVLAQV